MLTIGDLPVGARLRSRDPAFSCWIAAQSHPGYTGTTLLSESVVQILAFDAREPDNPSQKPLQGRKDYGNNSLKVSNLLQWLNSAEKDWYRPAHPYDAAPVSENLRHDTGGYTALPGYLTRLPRPVREGLLLSSVPVHCLDEAGQPAVEQVEARVFLPSRTEMGLGDDYGLPEGAPLPLARDIRFKSASLTAQAAGDYAGPWKPAFPMGPGSPWRYWLRSPNLNYAYLVRYMAEMGGCSFAPAWSEIVGVRPMMNVRSDLPVLGPGRTGNIYMLDEEGTV